MENLNRKKNIMEKVNNFVISNIKKSGGTY
jgi:hypothetical protein